MPWAPLLSEPEIVEGLVALPDWRHEGDALVRTIVCPSFREAIAVVNRVADAAEAANHHPDILVHGWNKVRLSLTNHSAGGLTEADFAMAKKFDGLD